MAPGMVVNEHVELLNAHQPFDADFAEIFFESANLDLQIVTQAFETLRASVEDPDVRLVVLTGDAGHGKTHLCGLLVAELNGQTLPEAAGILKDDQYGGADLASLSGDRSLRVIRDLSEKTSEPGGEVLAEAYGAEGTVTVVCGNDGHLRSCAGASGIQDLVGLLNDSVRRGRMRSVDGSITLINLNHQSVAAEGQETNIVRQLFDAWVADDEKWQECDGCPDRELCPILRNRNQLAEPGVGGASRFSATETLMRITERTGHTITVRQLLIYIAHLLTGGLRCVHVHERVDENPSDTSWQWEYLFHQVAFGDLLSEAQRRTLEVFIGTRRLDPARRAIRLVDDRFSDLKEDLGPFPPPHRPRGAEAPKTRRQREEEAGEHRVQWRFMRRRDFFDALIAPGDPNFVHPSHRVGLPHIGEFEGLLRPEMNAAELMDTRNLLLKGLEAIQGIHRSVRPGELYLVHPAFSARNSDTSVIGSSIRIGEIELMPRRDAWERRSGDQDPDVVKAVDWIERCVVLSLGGREAPADHCVELMLHEFEFLMTTARGLRSEKFFAAEIRRLLGELGRLANEDDGDRVTVFSGLQSHEFVLDGGTIQKTG